MTVVVIAAVIIKTQPPATATQSHQGEALGGSDAGKKEKRRGILNIQIQLVFVTYTTIHSTTCTETLFMTVCDIK